MARQKPILLPVESQQPPHQLGKFGIQIHRKGRTPQVTQFKIQIKDPFTDCFGILPPPNEPRKAPTFFSNESFILNASSMLSASFGPGKRRRQISLASGPHEEQSYLFRFMSEHLPAPSAAAEKMSAMTLSVLAGVFLLILKAVAWMITGSSAILSDLGESVSGLMDAADPAVHRQIVDLVNAETRQHGITHHNLRHRNIGDAHLVELHLSFTRDILLRDAHAVATQIEETVERTIHPAAHVITHLECDGDHDDSHSPAEKLS